LVRPNTAERIQISTNANGARFSMMSSMSGMISRPQSAFESFVSHRSVR
jgi:hypothetical protein